MYKSGSTEVEIMDIGMVGKKAGMTRIFTSDGESIPVTVIEIESNRVTQVKEIVTDGYRAVQVTTGSRRASRVTKPVAGHLAKAGVEPGRGFWEFRLRDGEFLRIGQELALGMFSVGQYVDVCGRAQGKGFAGGVKRHNFSTQDATHGNSVSHRAPGSIGQNQSPARVFKGKRMAGQMGNVNRVAMNLKIVRIDEARNLLLVKGCVPGARGGNLVVRPAVKKLREG